MKIKACNAFNAMFVNTVDTGVCGSIRCENSAFGLSTLSIQIWVEHFEYRMKSLPDWIRIVDTRLIRYWCCTIEDREQRKGLCQHCQYKDQSIQIWVEHFEYQMKSLPHWILIVDSVSIQGSSGTDVVLLKTESKERAYVNTVNTKIKAYRFE